MTSSQREYLSKQRSAAVSYSSRPVSPELVQQILEAANRTTSSFNLQPWHFVVINEHELKRLLVPITFNQAPLHQAPTIIAFVADSTSWQKPYDEVLRLSVASGVVSKPEALLSRRAVRDYFNLGWLGYRAFIRRLEYIFLHLGKPVSAPLSTLEEIRWFFKAQTMQTVTTAILAAEKHGLTYQRIDIFDEERLKRLLAIPREYCVTTILSLGYPLEGGASTPVLRLPLDRKLHHDVFGKK